jgi:nucleoside-diphosphate kinase
MDDNSMEQTLVLIKPDALLNSLTGYLLSTLSEFHTGLRFAGAKIVHVNRMLAEEHYAEHRGKPFYEPLLEYIMGRAHYPDTPQKRRVIAFVFRGPDAVLKIRGIAGPTDPHKARKERPGCIRSLGTIVPLTNAAGGAAGSRIDNLIHASASDEEAEREIKLWFRPSDIPPGMQSYPVTVSDAHYYFKDGELLTKYEPGSKFLLAPGKVAWSSDLEALRLLSKGDPAPCTLKSVAAKYLINERQEEEG